MVACWTVAAETTEEAERLAAPARMMFALMMQGALIAVPHPDKALRWLADNRVAMPPTRRPIVGTPDHCRAALQAKAALYGAEELMLVNILHDHQARLASYRLIADEMLAALAA
jgi:alkanesulfonate monooxygenase SsuD/methylene tetrahydromethanopterin reductase-like flavin-dependent oxidoreductase (luciferase family)